MAPAELLETLPSALERRIIFELGESAPVSMPLDPVQERMARQPSLITGHGVVKHHRILNERQCGEVPLESPAMKYGSVIAIYLIDIDADDTDFDTFLLFQHDAAKEEHQRCPSLPFAVGLPAYLLALQFLVVRLQAL